MDKNKENTETMPQEKEQKELIKEQKKPKTENGFVFGLLAFLVATLIMVAVLGVAFYFIIHNNVNGLGERYRSDLQSIPVLRLALPTPQNPEDDKFMTEAQVRDKYRELIKNRDEMKKQIDTGTSTIKELEKYKAESEKLKAENDKIKKDAEAQKKKIDDEKKALKEKEKKINELIANGDKAGLKEYFQEVEKETAQKIYTEIVKQEKVNEQAKQYSKIYETMDASAAAQIFQEMGEKKMDLIVETLKQMKKEVTAEILSSMDAPFAAKVSEKLKEAYVKLK